MLLETVTVHLYTETHFKHMSLCNRLVSTKPVQWERKLSQVLIHMQGSQTKHTLHCDCTQDHYIKVHCIMHSNPKILTDHGERMIPLA